MLEGVPVRKGCCKTKLWENQHIDTSTYQRILDKMISRYLANKGPRFGRDSDDIRQSLISFGPLLAKCVQPSGETICNVEFEAVNKCATLIDLTAAKLDQNKNLLATIGFDTAEEELHYQILLSPRY